MNVHTGGTRARVLGSAVVVVALIVAACSSPASQTGATVATPNVPTPGALASQSPSATASLAPVANEPVSLMAQLAARGLSCIECELFWNAIAASLVPAASTDPSTAAADHWAWLDIPLTTTRGADISLPSLVGRQVIIEMMATWCASCIDQQDTLREAQPSLPSDTVIISLSVDPRDDAATLARYAADHGYGWNFATGPVVLLRSVGAQFGDAALNPAVTPVVVIDRGGTVTLAPLGHKDVAAIIALVGN